MLLIRHAASTSNKACAEMAEETKKTESGYLPLHRWLEVLADMETVDARLTEDGIE